MNQYPTSNRGILLDPSHDGVFHINVYSKGKTDLGVALSNFSYRPFTHPVYGDFHSIEAFWYWLSTGRIYDHLRYLHGAQAKAAGRSYPRVQVVNFESEIAAAINMSITQHPALVQALKASTLPFTHYYKFDGKVVYAAQHDWIIDVIENRRMQEQNR